ncbi:MAG: hypothetical protein AAB325_16200, partial [Pseudomonadota bacterium]
MAIHTKAAKPKVAARKRPTAKKKIVVKARNAAARKAVARKPVRIEIKKQPRKLTPKQFAAKLKADKKEAKARDKAALNVGKQDKLRPAPVIAEIKPKTRQRLTAKEKALVREFERKELSPLEAEARRVRL